MKSDNHNHVLFDPLESMVASASAKGFNALSVTEHISQFKNIRNSVTFGSTHKSEGRMFSEFKEYLQEFQDSHHSQQIKIRRGLEVDYIPRYELEISRFVNEFEWDILLRSVHELNGHDIEEKNSQQDKVTSRVRWLEYFEIQKKVLADSEMEFQVLTHPLRIARSTPLYPENIDDLLFDLTGTAKSNGRAIELNGKDAARNYDLLRRLAASCASTKCIVSYGSDAHHPGEIGRSFEIVSQLIQQFGLQTLGI